MQTKLASDTIEMICRTSPIISTPSIDNAANAAPLAKALTQRSPASDPGFDPRAQCRWR